MSAFGWWATILVVGGYAAFCAHLYINQRNMIYFPTAESEAPNADAFRLTGEDGVPVKIWQLGRDDNADALVYFGGNAEDVALNAPTFPVWFPRLTLYLANYRGYGGSGGAPTEAGLFADALMLYDYARARHRRVSVLGRSLGSAVAGYVASRRDVHKLALITPFDSALNVARKMFPIVPVSVLLKDRYDTLSRAGEISAPVLVVIAGRDEIIPRRRSEALAAAFPAGQIRVTRIPHAGHNDLDDAPQYAEALRGFFNE